MRKTIKTLAAWFARRRERRMLAAVAAEIIQSSEASPAAAASASVITQALADRRPLCSFCFNPFEHRPRPWEQESHMRSVLMIPDSAPMPMICEPCFSASVGAFNRHATNVGTRNDGHTNMALALLH